MKDLILMLGSIAPTEMVVELLDEALQKYKLDQKKQNYDDLCSVCMLLIASRATKERGLEEVSAEVNEIDRLRERLNNNKTVQQ